MKRLAMAAALALGLSARASAQFCASCIQNSSISQNAQFNVSSATIRGPLTVGSINISSMSITTMTATVIIGGGAQITGLSASNVLSGKLSSATLTGPYFGITGVSSVTYGTWQANPVGSPYGGTGANLGTANPGSIPYFSSIGTMSALSPGTAGWWLVSGGSGGGAPYFSSAAPSGLIISSVAATGVVPGAYGNGQYSASVTLAADGRATSASANAITIGASSVTAGTFPTGLTLPLSDLPAGILPANVQASSVSATGVGAGKYGNGQYSAQVTFTSDGRASTATAIPITIGASSVTTGQFPHGLVLPLDDLAPGVMPSNIITSSAQATGIVAGSYGNGQYAVSIEFLGDGRASSATMSPILVNASSVTAGLFPVGVQIPAASVQSGALGASVLASSFPVSGVLAGQYGGPSNSPVITVNAQGIVTAATTVQIPGLSTHTAFNNVDNMWSNSQTSLAGSSWTFNGQLTAQGATASVSGSGSQLTIGTTSQYAGTVPNVTVFISSGNMVLTDGVHSPCIFYSTAGAMFCNVLGGTLVGSVAAGNVTAGTFPAGDILPVVNIDLSTVTAAIAFKASSGTDNSMSRAEALKTIDGPATVVSTLTVLGQIGAASLSPTTFISTNNFTNGFNAASQLVQLNGSGNLPALNGAALTSLTAANLVGAVPSGAVSFSTITTAFNAVGASTQTIQLNVGSATATLTTQINALGASTQTIQANVGVSTQTLSVYDPNAVTFGSSVSFRGAALSSGPMTFLSNVLESVSSNTAVGTAGYELSWSSGTAFTLILTGNPTFHISTVEAPSPLTAGNMVVRLRQDHSGSHTMTISQCDWGAAGAPTLTTAAGKMDIITIVNFGDANEYECFTSGQGFGP